MSDVIASDAQRLEQDAIVEMFELDATQYGDEILRFAPAPVDGGPVIFGGQTYQPLPVQAEGFVWSGKGTLPRPTLTVTAMELAFLSLVLSADDLVGAPVRRIRAYRKHLDDGSDPDPDAQFPVDHYVIERKTSQNRRQIQFELSAAMDQQGLQIPRRQVLRDTCTHRYRYYVDGQMQYAGVTCPYAGSGAWDTSGRPVSLVNDACGKRLSDCRMRFGQHAPLPFWGFPGVARYR